jgi:hypothetical protein
MPRAFASWTSSDFPQQFVGTFVVEQKRVLNAFDRSGFLLQDLGKLATLAGLFCKLPYDFLATDCESQGFPDQQPGRNPAFGKSVVRYELFGQFVHATQVVRGISRGRCGFNYQFPDREPDETTGVVGKDRGRAKAECPLLQYCFGLIGERVAVDLAGELSEGAFNIRVRTELEGLEEGCSAPGES